MSCGSQSYNHLIVDITRDYRIRLMFLDYDAEIKNNQNRRINKKRPYRVSFIAAKYPVALLLTQHTCPIKESCISGKGNFRTVSHYDIPVMVKPETIIIQNTVELCIN